jgi:hypothetical protein
MEKKVINKTIKVNSEREYYTNHLNIINALLSKKITDKEIEVLSFVLSLPDIIKYPDLFSSHVRKLIREEFKGSHAWLTNIVASLKDKKIIVRNNLTRYDLNSFIFNFKYNNVYTIMIEYEGL